jgi:L-ascorbate metabolism protein UlaG (beta-lactamase superfamily)
MTITKIGHCCLLIEVAGKRLLTDPGRYSSEQNSLLNIDLIIITHEHTDHLHTDSLLEIIKNNPTAQVVCNQSVAGIISGLGISPRIIDGTDEAEIVGVNITAHDGRHVTIYENFGQVQNTGYFIADTLFYPGDAYTNPQRPVPVLALPVSGPWCCISEVIDYVKEIKPGKALPVHDGQLTPDGQSSTHDLLEKTLADTKIEFIKLKTGEVIEISIN